MNGCKRAGRERGHVEGSLPQPWRRPMAFPKVISGLEMAL